MRSAIAACSDNKGSQDASPSGPIGMVEEMFAVNQTLSDVKLHGASSGLV